MRCNNNSDNERIKIYRNKFIANDERWNLREPAIFLINAPNLTIIMYKCAHVILEKEL